MPLHTQYRPHTLDQLIGHEEAVTRMKGIIKSGKVPSAILLTGPTSVGKTTLARAFAADLSGMGEKFLHTQDYKEVNFSEQRSIDDIRELIKLTRFRPQFSKYRVIVGDEAQGILSTPSAANALLKALEESPNAIWILCSMNPEKFKTTTIGKAIANRCVQFNLEPHTNNDLLKQAKRICSGEKMGYMMDDNYRLLKTVVKASNYEMRTLAQMLEACEQYYDGLEEKPEVLTEESLSSVLSSVESDEDKLAADFMTALFSLNYTKCQLSILNSSDCVGLSAKLMYLSSYLVNATVLNGKRHPKVWATTNNKAVMQTIQKLKVTLGMLGEVNTRLIECRSQIMQFGLGADALLSAFAYSTIRKLQTMQAVQNADKE